MRRWSIEELILHPLPEALQRHFDERNQIWLRRLMGFFLLVSVAGIAEHFGRGTLYLLVAPVLNVLLVIGIFRLLRQPELAFPFRRLVVGYLVGQFVLLHFYDPLDLGSLQPLCGLFLSLMLFFRLKTEVYLVVVGVYWGTFVLVELFGPRLGLTAGELESVLFFTVLAAVCLAIAIFMTRFRHKKFRTLWRRERLRHKEGLRMREELESARKIQLQMLPEGDEVVPWLDVASISLPATEVGGDYYDYFVLSESRVAVVIGDVAGHGVTSGILLSGVRSCLHLLHGYEEGPAGIMRKLDEVVRQTTDRRMFMTFQYVIFDCRSQTFSLSSAGHIPLLHFSKERGEVTEVAMGTLPLGTSLRSRYGIERVTFGAGDVFAFYTDGISELVDSKGRVYDSEGLAQGLAKAATAGLSAEAIRDALLDDLWDFQGDAPQKDDLTLVVVRPLVEKYS
jgi:serine phosphatase RsbU (regulator of sigma subunit)